MDTIALVSLIVMGAVVAVLGLSYGLYVDASRKQAVSQLAILLGYDESSKRARRRQPHAKSVAESLKELDALRSKNSIFNLKKLLYAAGYETDPKKFVMIWLVFLVSLMGILTLLALPTFALVLIGFGFAVVTWMYLKRTAKKRQARFVEEFSGSLDVIIRGVRNGMAVNACFKLVSKEGGPAVQGEFRKIFNDLDLGLPITQAMDRFAERVDLPEVKFFTIVVSLQARTGGNLSQTLENLSNLLKERKTLKGKIKALSSEAKTSAWIVGAMPVLVLGAVQLLSPEYTAPLYTTTTGHFVIAGCLFWMGMGVFVMAQMINLET